MLLSRILQTLNLDPPTVSCPYRFPIATPLI